MASQYVAIDLHRRRLVIVRQTPDGEVVDSARIDNDPVALACEVAKAGDDPEVVLEATYGMLSDVTTAPGGRRATVARPSGTTIAPSAAASPAVSRATAATASAHCGPARRPRGAAGDSSR